MAAPTSNETKIKVLKAEIGKVSKRLDLIKQDLEASKKAFLEAVKELNSPANNN